MRMGYRVGEGLEAGSSHTCTEGITEHGGAQASMATASGSFWEISCVGFEGWPLEKWKESAILIANESTMRPINNARGVLLTNNRE